ATACGCGPAPGRMVLPARGAAAGPARSTAPTSGGRAAPATGGGRGGSRLRIRPGPRRFFCGTPDCPARTFAEQVSGLTSRRSRRTPPLARALASIALGLAGRAGARLPGALDLTASRSSMLRLVMALPDPQAGTLTIVGIDDFAFRRGRDYGTILINVETGRPVDLLRDR